MTNNAPRSEFSKFYRHLNNIKYEGCLGLELEQEFSEPPKIDKLKHWVIKEDHSLRNYGLEFVSPAPVTIENLDSNLAELEKAVNIPSLIRNCPRTSFHVHRNVTNMHPEKIVNSIILYWLLENALFKLCDREREGHLFCLRLQDAPGVLMTLRTSILDDYTPFHAFDNDAWRYGGINLNALLKFGSLEARGMHGTHSASEMKRWAILFDRIISGGDNFSNPSTLMDVFYKMPRKSFFSLLLGDSLYEELVKHAHNFNDLVDENVCTVTGLAYCTDWNAWIRKLEKNLQKLGPSHSNLPPQVRGRNALPPLGENIWDLVNPARAVRINNVVERNNDDE